jgi:hypothetical protein
MTGTGVSILSTATMTPHPAQLTFARGLPVASVEVAGDGAAVETAVAGAVVTGAAGVAEVRVSGDRIARAVRRSVATAPVSDQPAISTIPANEASAIPIRSRIFSGRVGLPVFMERTVAGGRDEVGTVPNTIVPFGKWKLPSRRACESADLCTVPDIPPGNELH